jgi:hypothetical protein
MLSRVPEISRDALRTGTAAISFLRSDRVCLSGRGKHGAPHPWSAGEGRSSETYKVRRTKRQQRPLCVARETWRWGNGMDLVQ